jgi:hypothetical protein
MSRQAGKSNIADDAARARKLLDKHTPAKLSGLNKGNYVLQQGITKNLGEHAVMVILGAQTCHQFTLSHPIGVTDGDDGQDWVLNKTEYIPSMLSRQLDPGLGALNQARAKTRTQLAIDHGLLVLNEQHGKQFLFYPNRADSTRNDLLDQARNALKEDIQRLRAELQGAEDRAKKVSVSNLIAQVADPIKYLDEVTASAESNLRQFWNTPEVAALLEYEHPQNYRTLTGPYADQPQVMIAGAKGKSLDAVANAIAEKLSQITLEETTVVTTGGSIQGTAATVMVTGVPQPEGAATAAPEGHERRGSMLRSALASAASPFKAALGLGGAGVNDPNTPDEEEKAGNPVPPSVNPPKPPVTGGKGGSGKKGKDKI